MQTTICRLPRVMRFLMVGSVCTILHLTLFSVSQWALHMPLNPERTIAYAAALFVSTQMNFCLSQKITFPDRAHASWRSTWMQFNISSAVATAINITVFWIFSHIIISPAATLIGTCAGLIWNYTASNMVVFRLPQTGVVDSLSPITDNK
jgi:putative flippase GtrA